MTYIHNGQSHDDYTHEYMSSLGMTDETIESVLSQRDFDTLKLEELAKQTRQKLVEQNIELFGHEWQVSNDDMKNIQDHIYESEHEQYLTGSTVEWILADNSTRLTTTEELIAIRYERAKRKSVIYAAYIEWRKGDKQAPFSIAITD